jgi:mannose-6-phosphate isomerase class I
VSEGSARGYDAQPRYPTVGGDVEIGLGVAVDEVWAGTIIALDGPQVLGWEQVVDELCNMLHRRDLAVRRVDMRAYLRRWDEIVGQTSQAALLDDPDFETLPTGTLADLFDELPTPQRITGGVILVHGPGAALVEHDVLWYADLPKRYAEAAVKGGSGTNLGQPPETGIGSTKRLFYVDWPLLDRHRDAIAPGIDRWFDVQSSARTTSIRGQVLIRTSTALSRQPFRTRPTFNTTPWGGHWAQRELGVNPDARNTALGYELIAPESGVLVGGPNANVEIPFQLIVSLCPRDLLGDAVHAQFGTSFPIRFDYLDTLGGGPLSVHVHPQQEYMQRVFGWPYTQHETYYMMLGGSEQRVYLGLRDETDIESFQSAARSAADAAEPYDVEKFVQMFEATPHQLFLVPAGTPHASGQGNVVLEVSSTPYLYSLRFYDWLRTDASGAQRPVHVSHAFANLNQSRYGAAVARDLVPAPTTIRAGSGWREELLGREPEMFFDVRRLVLDGTSDLPDDTSGRFHVLNVVEGRGVTVMSHDGYRHWVAYAETLVIPAAVGSYTLAAAPGGARVVKAVVR